MSEQIEEKTDANADVEIKESPVIEQNQTLDVKTDDSPAEQLPDK